MVKFRETFYSHPDASHQIWSQWAFRFRRRSKILIFMMAVMVELVTPMLPIKFQDNRPFVPGEEAKIDLQDDGNGGHLGFPIGATLASFFYLQVTPMLLSKFHVN